MSASDTVARDIFQRRVVGVAEEMSAALRRSAFSSIIWEMYDYSCALFTADGRIDRAGRDHRRSTRHHGNGLRAHQRGRADRQLV
jgi:hypothetical protein